MVPGICRRNEGDWPDRVGSGSGGDPLTGLLGIKEEGPVIAHREIQAIQTLSLSSIVASKHLDGKKGGIPDALCSGDGDRVLKERCPFGCPRYIGQQKQKPTLLFTWWRHLRSHDTYNTMYADIDVKKTTIELENEGTIMLASNVLDEKPHPEELWTLLSWLEDYQESWSSPYHASIRLSLILAELSGRS